MRTATAIATQDGDALTVQRRTMAPAEVLIVVLIVVMLQQQQQQQQRPKRHLWQQQPKG